MRITDLSMEASPHPSSLGGVEARPEHLEHFAQAVIGVPVCNFVDLRNTGLYSIDPQGFEGLYKGSDSSPQGSAYAWKRLPRFLDDFRRIRTSLQETYPGELIMGLDLGSSFPIYSELMRSVNFRKAGDYAERAIASSFASLAEKHRDLGFDKNAAAFVSSHSRHKSELRAALVSGLQLALYTIPEELSGDHEAIRDYLGSILSSYIVSSKRHIDRKDRKEPQNLLCMSEKLGIDLSRCVATPMERAWRIDSVLDTMSDETTYELASGTYYKELDSSAAEEIVCLYSLAGLAKKEGDLESAEHFSRQADEIKKGSTRQYKLGDELSDELLSWICKDAVATVIKNNHAFPVRFLSVDIRDPKELLEEAAASFDIETLISGLYRRTRERLLRGDPDHLHCSIREVIGQTKERSLASITSIESWPFYADRPKRHRDVKAAAKEIAEDMISLVERLKECGEYMTFTWGEVPFLGEGEEPTSARVARKELIPEVEKLLLPITYGAEVAYLTQRYCQEEVQSWMTDGEYSSLVPRSPIFDENRAENGFEVLRLQRGRGRRRKGASKPLLGPRQL